MRYAYCTLPKLFAYLHFPLFRHRVAQAGQGILTNMFEHVAA
jgi:hypothetical protein